MPDAESESTSSWAIPYAREVIVAIVSGVVTFAAAAGIGLATGLLDYSTAVQKHQASRIDYLSERVDHLARQNAQLNRTITRREEQRRDYRDSMAYVVAELQWKYYRRGQRIGALENQIEALGKVPIQPPEFNLRWHKLPEGVYPDDSGSILYVPGLPQLAIVTRYAPS